MSVTKRFVYQVCAPWEHTVGLWLGGKLAGFVKVRWVVVNPPKRIAVRDWRRLSREEESVAG